MSQISLNPHKKIKAILKAKDKEIEHGLELHKSSIVCDTFGFHPKPFTKRMIAVISEMIEKGEPGGTIQQKYVEMPLTEVCKNKIAQKMYFEALNKAGVTCIVHNVGEGNNILSTIDWLSRFSYKCDMLSDRLFKAVRVRDIIKAKEQNRHCLMFSLNSPPVENMELKWIEVFYRLGVRMMHLTYNRRNFIGNGCTEFNDSGLSCFGVDVVKKMNDIGVIVDTAHSGPKTTLDAAKYSKYPIVASHTGCDRLFHHDRNKSDEELKAIAKTGGLAGVYAVSNFLGKKATIKHMLDHIDYAVKLIGVDHVGIGTDYGYSPRPKLLTNKPWPDVKPDKSGNWRPEHNLTGPVQKWAGEERRNGSLAWINWPYFTVGLVTRGYSDKDIKKIIGQNLLRVFRDNEK